MKSGGFHEIREIWQISWNLADFTMKSDVSAKTLLILQGLGWISPEIRRISYGFHEIRRISYGFHVKSKDLCKEL